MKYRVGKPNEISNAIEISVTTAEAAAPASNLLLIRCQQIKYE